MLVLRYSDLWDLLYFGVCCLGTPGDSCGLPNDSYQQHCYRHHGDGGDGDGVQACDVGE